MITNLKTLLLLLSMLITTLVAANYIPSPAKSTFYITGNSEISIEPDRAIVPIGVQIKHDNLITAREQVDEVIKKLFAKFKKLKIEKKHIKSTQIEIYPVYEKVRNKEKNHYEEILIGYNVYRQLEIDLQDITLIGELMHEAVLLGATNMSSPRFYMSNKNALHNQVINDAIENAQTSAQHMADKLDIKLGKIITVRSNPINYAYPRRNYYSMNLMRQEPASRSSSSTYSEGQIKLKTSVNITYEIVE